MKSYEEATNALEKETENISTYDFNRYVPLVGYYGNEAAFATFANELANNTTCKRLR